MPKSWATSGSSSRSSWPMGCGPGLEHELREAIRTGRLQPGSRLPSSRSLAKDLRVGRNSVADALAQLVAEGWLVARHGAGTWVADRPDRDDAAPPTDPVQERARRDSTCDPAHPTSAAFPRSAWLAAARRALAVAADDTLGYGDPRGLPVLREALAGYLGRARGSPSIRRGSSCAPGSPRASSSICARLRGHGATTFAVEAFGHRLHREIIEGSGLAATAVPVDDRGADVDRARRRGGNPPHAGPPVPDRCRPRAGPPARGDQWAADTGAIVVEDDYDGEFRYDRQAVGAMQSLAPDHVVYAGTAARASSPGSGSAGSCCPPPGRRGRRASNGPGGRSPAPSTSSPSPSSSPAERTTDSPPGPARLPDSARPAHRHPRRAGAQPWP